MRITAATLYRDSAAALERASERVIEQQRLVSSGQRIGRPSDDPAGAAAAIAERQGIAGLEQYARTTDSVASWLAVADSALSDVIHRLSNAQVTVLSARGSAKTGAEREAAALGLESLRAAILSDLNTSFRGAYVFGGAESGSPPFVAGTDGTVAPYAGAQREVAVDIGERREVVIGFDGGALAKGTAARDVFATLDAAIAAARAGDDAALQQAGVELDAALERATAAQMRVGSSLAAIDAQQVQLTGRRLAAAARIAALENADLAQAITGLNAADAAHRAALGAAGRITQLSLMDYLK